MPRLPLSRRHMLRGAGVTLGLPFLEAMVPRVEAASSRFKPWAKAAGASVPCLICCYVPNGVNIIDWVPTDSGENYQLSPTLSVLKVHRSDFTVISGLGHPSCFTGRA